MPSAGWSRCSRGAGRARFPATSAPATAPTAHWDVKGGVAGSAGPVTSRCRRRRKQSNGLQHDRESGQLPLQPRPRRLQQPERVGERRRHARPGTGIERRSTSGAASTTSSTAARISTTARSRSPRRGRWRAATGSRRSGCRGSRRREGIDDSQTQTAYGNFPFKTTQRQYTWQNEFALPIGALTAGYERREERVATDAGFATTSRNTDSVFGIYQLRVDAQAVQANLRYDESSQYGGETTGAIAYGYRSEPCLRASPPATAPASRRRRSTISTTRASPIRIWCRRPRATSKAASTGAARWPARASTRALIGYRNKFSELIVFQCDIDFNCAPHNVDRATLEGVTLGVDLRTDDGATVAASLDVQSPAERPHRQAAAAARAAARRADRRVSAGPGAARPRARRVVAALRRSGEPREDGRLRASSI